VVAIYIHDLLTKGAGGRSRENRKTKEAAHTDVVNAGLHHAVFAVLSRGKGRGPHIGVVDIQAPEALNVALATSTSEETVESDTINISRGRTLRVIFWLAQIRGGPFLAGGARGFVPASREATYSMINDTANAKATDVSRYTGLVVGVAWKGRA
jgi:hypothetical protein